MTEPTPIRGHRRYNRRQKATVVIAAEMSTAAAAAEASGIPESTVRYWLDSPAFAELRTKTREDMAEESAVLAHKALEAINRRLPEFEPRDLTILFGVLVEKTQLLSGEATTRSEHRELTETMDDGEREKLSAAIDEWLAAHADPEPR